MDRASLSQAWTNPGLALYFGGTEREVTMIRQRLEHKQTQIRFKMQKDGKPVWDQVTIDRLWMTTQREAMIESDPAPASLQASTAPTTTPPVEKAAEPTAK